MTLIDRLRTGTHEQAVDTDSQPYRDGWADANGRNVNGGPYNAWGLKQYQAGMNDALAAAIMETRNG